MTLDPSMCTERSWPCASMPRPLEGEDWCALAVRCPRRHTGRHTAGARAPGPPTFSRTGGSSAAVRASRRAGRWQASTRSAGCTAGGGPRHRPSCDARRNGGAAALRCEERSSGACASQQQWRTLFHPYMRSPRLGGAFHHAVAWLRRDDGAAVYVNGEAVSRSPTVPVSGTSPRRSRSRPDPAAQTVSAREERLRWGTLEGWMRVSSTRRSSFASSSRLELASCSLVVRR